MQQATRGAMHRQQHHHCLQSSRCITSSSRSRDREVVHHQQQQRVVCQAAPAAASAEAVAAAAAPSSFSGLSPQQLQQFHEDGFLAIPGFASPQQVSALLGRADELIAAWDPAADNKRLSVFTTKEEQTHAKDAYFLDSSAQVNFFFEEKAFDASSGQLAVPKALAVNKIGHAMHDLDPVFRSFARSPAVEAVCRSLGFVRPLPVQSMYICKQPRIGGEVTPHQDSAFLFTDPPSCVGLWLALQPASRANGCLWGLRGVHKQGLARRFRRLPHGGVGFDGPPAEYDLAAFEPIEVEAGTLVLLHGANVHYSAENTSPVSRHSWALHVVESAPGFSWAPDNWAQRPPDNPWTPLYESSSSSSTAAGA